jgi:hypothetical protein
VSYHPDPDLLEQLATKWEGKADDIDRLRFIGGSNIESVNWSGVAQNAAVELIGEVSRQLGNTSELCRRWARQLRKMAKKIRDELAKEAKNTLRLILGLIFGLLAGIFVGWALGPAIAFLAGAIAAAIAGASEILATMLTLVFEFAIGALAFGSMQFAVDMFVEQMASWITGTPFELNPKEWENVLIGALIGGLFSLSPSVLASLKSLPWKSSFQDTVKNLPWKNNGSSTAVVDSHPTANPALGGDELKPLDISVDGGSGVDSAGGFDVDGAATTDLPTPAPTTFSAAAGDLGKGEANLGATPRIGPDVNVSASSVSRTNPVGGSAGTRGVVNADFRPGPVESEGVVAPRAFRQGNPEVGKPNTLAQSKPPSANLARGGGRPETVDTPPAKATTNATGNRLTKPPAQRPVDATPQRGGPKNALNRPAAAEPPPNAHNQTASPQARAGTPAAKPPSAPKIPGNEESKATDLGVRSQPPPAAAHPTANPAAGHPSAKFTPAKPLEAEAAPPTANPANAATHGPAGLRSRDLRWDSQEKPELLDGLRGKIGVAHGIDTVHPDLDGDFAKALKTVDSGGALTKDQAAKLLTGFKEGASGQFGKSMDQAFSKGRPPTAGEKAAWARAYGKMLNGLHTDIRAEANVAKIDAAAARLQEKFGPAHPDPITGETSPRFTRALQDWKADANGLVKQAEKNGNWRGIEGDLKALEGRFNDHLGRQGRADQDAARAVARFDEILSGRKTPLVADEGRIAALRADLYDAAHDASRAGKLFLEERPQNLVDRYNPLDRDWIDLHETMIHSRLNYLARTHEAVENAKAEIRAGTWLKPDASPGGPAQAAENAALVRQVDALADGYSGSFAKQVRPQQSFFVTGKLRQFVQSAPERVKFGTRAGDLLDGATAKIKSEAAAGEADAIRSVLNHAGSADRAIAGAETKLTKFFSDGLARLEKSGFKPAEVEQTLKFLEARANGIPGQVRRGTLDDAAMQSAESEANRMIAAEVAGQGLHLGRGTVDRLADDFKPEVLVRYHDAFGLGSGARNVVAKWLGSRPVGDAEFAADKSLIDKLFPDTARPPAPARPAPRTDPGPDSATPPPPGSEPGEASLPGPHDMQVFRMDLDMPQINLEQLLGNGKDLSPFGGAPRPGELRPGDLPVGKSDFDADPLRPAPRHPEPAGKAPTYQDALDGDKLPDYETARRDPVPQPNQGDVLRYMAENQAVERQLIVPKQLDGPMSGVDREIDRILAERRDGLAQHVEDLGRVSRADPKVPGSGRFDDSVSHDPFASADPRPSTRDLAWNAMAKNEANLRSTLDDGVRPGGEPGGIAGGRPNPPRSGRQIADDLRRFANGPKDGPPPDAAAVRSQVRGLRNEDLDQANAWLRNNPGEDWASIRGRITDEWQARYDRGDLTPGAGTIGAHEAARRLASPPAPRTVDIGALRADYLAKAQTARDFRAILERITAEHGVVRDAIRRQYLGGEARPGQVQLGDEDVSALVAEMNRLKLGLPAKALATDRQLAKADGELAEIDPERTVIADLKAGLDKAIAVAEQQVRDLFDKLRVSPEAAGPYAAARDELTRLTTWRDQGLTGAEPRTTPAAQALYRHFQEQGVVPALRPAAARPSLDASPAGVRRDVLAMMDDLENASARLAGRPTPRLQDPEWLAAHPGTRGDEAVADWLDAYTAVHDRWNGLTVLQRQGPEARDTVLKHLQQAALSRRDEALLTITRQTVDAAAAHASNLADKARGALIRAIAATETVMEKATPPSEPTTGLPASEAKPPAPAEPETVAPAANPATEDGYAALPPERLATPTPDGLATPTPDGLAEPTPVNPASLEERFAALRPNRPVEPPPANPATLEERFAALRPDRPAEPRPVNPATLEERFAALRPNRSADPEPVTPPVDTETPPVETALVETPRVETPPVETPPAETAPPPAADSIRFSDPERQAAWQRIRQGLIDSLPARLGNAAAVNRIVPDLEGDFVRERNATPGGDDFTEAQVVERFEKFGATASRSFNEIMSPAFTEVRPPSAREQGQWQQRYDELLRDLRDDLREQAGRNAIEAAAGRALGRWREQDPDLAFAYDGDLDNWTFARGREQDPDRVTAYQRALHHWTADSGLVLDSMRAARTWDHAPGTLAQWARKLDVYLEIHLGAQRAAGRVGDKFDEIVTAREATLADLERVARARTEAMAAAYGRYVHWWRPTRINNAAPDLPAEDVVAARNAMVAKADQRFGEFADAIRTRLDYLDETQSMLDWMAKMTRPDLLPKSPLLALDEEQLESVARLAQRDAESVVDGRATPFVRNPPEVTESLLKAVRIEIVKLRDQIPARAAFAARATELTRDAVQRIDTEAAVGAVEALNHGLDPAAALTRVPADARTAVFEMARDIREQFAGQQYAESALADTLATLERNIGEAVSRVRVDTIRDALLRRGDAEAVEVLNEHAAVPGAGLGAMVQERVYGDIERDFVEQYHQLFADGADFDVAAWLRRTPPEHEAPAAVEGGPEVRLLTGPEMSPEASTEASLKAIFKTTPRAGSGASPENLAQLGAMVAPGERADPVAWQELFVAKLPEAERAGWNQRLQDAVTDTERADVDDALEQRTTEVHSIRLANDAALAELVRDVRQAWDQAGRGRVTPAELGPLVRRFQGVATDLDPRSAEPGGSLPEFPAVTAPDPAPPVATAEPISQADRLKQLEGLPSRAEKTYGDHFDLRLSGKVNEWFREAAKSLPYRIRESFFADYLKVRGNPEGSQAVRRAMNAAAEAERAKLPIARRHPELTPHAAEQFTRQIEDAGSLADIARIEQEAARAAETAAARTDAAKPSPSPSPTAAPKAEAAKQPTFEEQLAILAKFRPRHGYRVIGAGTPIITRAQAAAYDLEVAQLSTTGELAAFEERLRQDGYVREPGEADQALTAARITGLPATPMQPENLVAMFRRWVDQEARGTGVDKTVPTQAVTAIDEALAAGDGTAMYQAVTEFVDAVLAARLTALKPAKPAPDTPVGKPADSPANTTIAQPADSPANTTVAEPGGTEDVAADLEKLRAEVLAQTDPEEAATRELLADPAIQSPTTTPRTPVAPRSIEALRQQMPEIPAGDPQAPAHGDGPATAPGAHIPDPDGFDDEIRRMAEAEGRVGGRRGGADPDADLAKRLRKLHETPEEHETTAEPAGPGTAEVAAKPPPPAPGGHGPAEAEVEMIQADGTVVTRKGPAVTEPAISGLAGQRGQLSEIGEVHPETEAAYDSYLALARDLRAQREDLASRFTAKVDQWRADHPELAANLREADLAGLEQGIAELVARHFPTVRATIPEAAGQRTMIAGLIAEKVEALGPKLEAAATSRPAPEPAPPEAPATRVDELAEESFDSVVGGRYLGAEDYARLRDAFRDQGRAAAGAPGTADGWVPTAEWAATMDSAVQRLADELAVLSVGDHWFGRIVDAVAYDRGDDPGEATPLPQEGWYRQQFQKRLVADYAQVWSAVPAGQFASGAAHLASLDATQDPVGKPEWAAWRQSFSAGLDWLRDQLNLAHDLRSVLVAAAGDFRRLTMAGGADAMTTAALAGLFRHDKVGDHLTGKGLPSDALDAWLEREKADTDVFGESLARLAEAEQARPVEFVAKTTRVTDALITEFTPRVATAGEVAQRRPDFATRFADEVRGAGARTAELAEAFRRLAPDEELAAVETRFRTLDALAPADLIDRHDQVVYELTDLYHRVWNYPVQIGAAVGSEHWRAAAGRWDELSTQYWTDLRTASMRQTWTERLRPAIDELRAGAEQAKLSPKDSAAAVAAFTKDAGAAIDQLLHNGPFDPARLGRWAELESDLLAGVPHYLRVAQARAAEAERAAEAFQAKTRDTELPEPERAARAAEVAADATDTFDLAYRQFRWADDDQRLAQAEYAAAKQRAALVDRAAERPVTEPSESAGEERPSPVERLADDTRNKLDEHRRGADWADLAALQRIGAEIEAVISAAQRDVQAAQFATGLVERAVDKARARLAEILGSVPPRLADERRLADALAAATGKFDALPGADQLGADDPVRYRFLDEVASKAAVGVAYLTRSAQSAAVAAQLRAIRRPSAGTTALGAPAPAPAQGTSTGPAVDLPAGLPPVELTPLATPPPAAPPAQLAIAPEAPVDPEATFRADLYARLGSVPAPDAVDDFADGLAGEKAAVHWSLQTLAHHGGQWLDEGITFLDESDPTIRERLLVDAARDAPAGALLAFSRLIRGVSADSERDLPVATTLRAVHLALTGDARHADQAEAMIRTTWNKELPSRNALIGALVDRSASDLERRALHRLGLALVTC